MLAFDAARFTDLWNGSDRLSLRLLETVNADLGRLPEHRQQPPDPPQTPRPASRPPTRLVLSSRDATLRAACRSGRVALGLPRRPPGPGGEQLDEDAGLALRASGRDGFGDDGRLFCRPRRRFAQTDEIQVYNAEIAAPGVFNLTVHNNYTPDGLKQPAFPGAIVSNHALNGVPEFAYGVTDWFEAGLYFPLYSVAGDGQAQINGFKLRALFVDPHAGEKRFFYGVNFEFSFNSHNWDPHT